MKNKQYIEVRNFLTAGTFFGSPRTAQEWKKYGIDEKSEYYEFDLSKLSKVKMTLIVENL